MTSHRIPDGGLFPPGTDGTWISTASIVIEIVSPDDESWETLPYFAKRGVGEVLIVDPAQRSVDWLTLAGDHYTAVERSGLIDLGGGELASRIVWP